MVKTRGDHRGVSGVELDEAFEFDTAWAPLGGEADGAGMMDDDEWFQQVHDGHEKIWTEEEQQYKDVRAALIDVGPVKRLELGAAACKVKNVTPSSSCRSSFRRSSARDSTCSGASTARRVGSPLQHTPPVRSSARSSRSSSIGSVGYSSVGVQGGSAPSSAKTQTKKSGGIAKQSAAVKAAPLSSSSAAASKATSAKSLAVLSKQSASAAKASTSSLAAKLSASSAIQGTARSKHKSPLPPTTLPSPPPVQSKADLQAMLREHNRRVRRAQLGLA